MKRTGKTIIRPAAAIAGPILLWAALAGCKTDALVGPSRTPPEGPVTSLENPAGVELPGIPLAGRTEVDLVEEMVRHRAMYAQYLKVLAAFYTENGYEEKAIWARTELNDLRRVKPYRYILDAEVPVAALQPTESVAEADALYEEGRALMTKGGHGVPVFYHQQTMKQALARFKELANRYPTSDKIDDAAFYIAEIHKEYLEEKDNTIALLWYQRAIDWNPNLPYPARFQMAVVYDRRMHEREKALHWYQQVLEKERSLNKSNTDFASARIRELTPKEALESPAEPVAELPGDSAGSPEPGGESIEASPKPPARVP